MKTVIKVSSDEDRVLFLHLMLKAGYRMSDSHSRKSPEQFADYSVGREYINIIMNSSTKLIHSCNDNYIRDNASTVLNWPAESNDILPILFDIKPEKTYVVQNVGDYSAKVTKEGIEVGCQTIPFEKLNEIVAMVNKFKNDQ